MKKGFAPTLPMMPLVFVILTVGQASLALAQAPAASLEGLLKRVRVGDTVYVTDQSGRETKGALLDLSDTSLDIAGPEGTNRSLPADSIRTIKWRRPDSLANGALIGVGIGAGTALAGAAAYCANEGSCGAADYLVVALVYGGIGAGIGVGIDALIPGKKVLVYQKPRASARLSVAPFVTTTRKGAVVRLAF